MASTHIIGRQNIRLRYQGRMDPLALQQIVSQVCREELPERLSDLFDRYDDKDKVLRLGKLEVNIVLTSDANLQEQLSKAIVSAVAQALQQQLEARVTEALSLERSFTRLLCFYLEQGYLPWWALRKDPQVFKQKLKEQLQEDNLKQLVREVLPVLHQYDARCRLLALLDDASFERFIAASGFWPEQEWQAWKALKEMLGRQVPQAAFESFFRQAVLEASTPGASRTGKLAALLVQKFKQLQGHITVRHLDAIQNTSIRNALRAALSGEKPSAEIPQTLPSETPSPNESIHIRNAGLILLAPFLPAFFARLGLLEAGLLQDGSHGISLLRYLVFGAGDFDEMEVPLEKVLCGLALSESLEKGRQLSAFEKQEADSLLASVITHWEVLKNTSPNGLRYNFLQREGRLAFKENLWEVAVQKQSHDILLDYLPWSISMIKLPWMPQLLAVKWNS